MYLKNLNLTLNENTEQLPVMDLIPKINKSYSCWYIIVLVFYITITLCKDVTFNFKITFNKAQLYHTKWRIWSGFKSFWAVKNSSLLICNVRNVNLWKSAKSVCLYILQIFIQRKLVQIHYLMGITVVLDPAQFFVHVEAAAQTCFLK